MTEILAFAACTLLAVLAIFQILLIFGAPIGRYAWGGSHIILPTKLRIGSAVSVSLYFIFALIILGSANLLGLSAESSIFNVGIWILTAYFTLGTFMNGISRSKHERAVMTPVAAALALACVLIALN